MVDKYKVFVYNIGSSKRKDWNNGGSGFKSSIIHLYERNPAIYVSQIEENKCTLEIYQDFQIKKKFEGSTPDEVWNLSHQLQKCKESELFGLENSKVQNLIHQDYIPKCSWDNWINYSIMKKLFDYHLKRRTITSIEWHEFFISWANFNNLIIELESTLKILYSAKYQFNDRELGAWRSMLCAAGCTNVTPWSHD